MKFLQIFSLLLVATASTLTQSTISQPKYSEVRIFATSEAEFRKMMDAGLFIDHANRKPGYYLDAWLSENELELLKNSGVPYEILVDDWDVYFNSLPKMSQAEIDESIRQSAQLYNVSHSIYGSMGGYLTFVEVVAKLDSMRLEYPQFISQKFSLGTTHEGRDIWAVRVTKNPDSPAGKPEVLYHALIHAREPESMETQVYYFYWLFENYGTDPTATYILNNREIYWVPVFNPDGYVYNQMINPNGGGMWRANKRPIVGTCPGSATNGPVDLNRNYGIYEFWNSSNGGSSTNPCAGGGGTYRGTNPFSEPETQAIMNFVNSRNFNASFGAHTYGNLLIKPWAWIDPTPTPDDNTFNQFLSDMKVSNPIYRTGTPSQTVGYFVRGGSDDWYYNDSVHTPHHIFAITPETGTSFWPPQNQIVPLAQGMLFNNQYMSLIAGPYVNPLSRSFNQQTYTSGQPGIYKVVFRNKGTMAAGNVTVKWTSTSSRITIPTTQFTYPSLDSFATDSSIFNFTISPLAGSNSAIPTLFTIKLDTATVYTATAYVLVGTGTIVLNDNGNTFTNWTTNGTWAVTTSQFNSPPSSFTDSPVGNYGNNANNSMTLASPLNATSTPVFFLSFYHRYATETNYDFCKVEVSNDNGTSWQTVVSYSGTLSTWAQQAFDITDFADGSSQVKIRFRLSSDVAVTGDGWYVDDVRVNGYVIEEPQWYIDDLRDTTNQADYIIVSPQAYISVLEPLAAFRSTHDSLNVAIVVTDSIYSSFGQGVAQDSAIKSFFSFVLRRWQNPKPEYILLAGNVNTILSHKEPGIAFLNEDSVMVDQWLVEGLIDSASPNRVDAAVGRFPAWNEQQLQTMISKTITYELLTDSSWFSRNIQVADSGEASFFEQTSGMWLQTVSSRWPDTTRVHVRENSPFYRTRTQFRDLFNQGAAIISLFGHMNFYQFSPSAYFTTWDVDSLSNGDRLPLCFLAYNQRFEREDTLSIAANLLQDSGKGAVATVAPAGAVFVFADIPEFIQRTFEEMVSYPSQSIGKTIRTIKNTMGGGTHRSIAKQTLLGDPALIIKHGAITSVPQQSEIPQHFALHQNYPNPFNPETIIEFDIVSKEFVTLRVYNILGQEVASLVNEELSQGKYSIKFSTGQYNLASGVYFYRINAGAYSSIKKMLLMK